MSHFIHAYINGSDYEVHLRGSTIVHIMQHDSNVASSHEVQYDNLSMSVREALLIAIIEELTRI